MNTGPSLDDSLLSLAQMKKEYPSPPPMHWFGVLLASAVVGGLGEWLSRHTGLPFLGSLLSSEVVLYLWLCVQSAFVQRLEPESHSLTATLLGGASIAAGYGLSVMGNGSSMPWKGIAVLLVLAGPLLLLCDLFRMRRTLERHYNDIEPYGCS